MEFKISITRYKSIIENLYIAVLALALILHIFNMGGEEGLKPFHIAAVMACAFTIVFSKKDALFVYLGLFILCVAISAMMSPVNGAFSGLINVLIVSLCCYGTSTIKIDTLLKFMLFFIPFDLLVLLFDAIQNPTYRYQGFYNDPNYLCTTLIVFFYLCVLSFLRFENKLVRLLIVTDIIIIIFLVILSLSRTGMACVLLLLLISFASAIKKHFWKVLLIAFIALFALQHYAMEFVDEEYELVYDRLFENNDNLESAGDLRSELSKQNLRFILDNPSYSFFGLGPSGTDGDNAIDIPELLPYKKSSFRDHNTWTSCLSEYGIFATILFSVIIITTIKRLFALTSKRSKYVSIAFCFIILLFSLSIWQMTYLPFWWGLFLLNNEDLNSISEIGVTSDQTAPLS